jgi:hypothetical protein
MNILKKALTTWLIIVLAFIINLIYVKPTNAQVPELHIKLEVRKAGTSWHNYNGTEPSDHEILNCDPGDKVTVKVKIWNTGVVSAALIGSEVIHNAEYIASISNVNLNADGNGRSFTGDFLDISTPATITQVDAGSSEDLGFESMTGDVILSDDFPAGETFIDGAAGVISTEIEGGQEKTPTFHPPLFSYLNKLFSPDIAYANGYEQYSGVRISVNGGLPDTGADL